MSQSLPRTLFNFRRSAGAINGAAISWLEALSPTPKVLHKLTQAQRAGLYYEHKALDHLYTVLPGFVDHLPFRFHTQGAMRTQVAIPDGIVNLPERNQLIIVEVKLQHTHDGYRQLNDFYAPIVKAALPAYDIRLLEVCRTFHPNIRGIPAVVPAFDVADWVERTNDYFGVYIFSGRK